MLLEFANDGGIFRWRNEGNDRIGIAIIVVVVIISVVAIITGKKGENER